MSSLRKGAWALVNIARDNDIEVDYRAGMTLRNLSAKYSISHERIRQILKRRGLSKTDGGGYMKKELLRKKIKNLIDDGHADSEIAHLLNVELSYINGTKLFFRKKANEKKKRERRDLIIGLCEEGRSQKTIARMLAIPTDTVRKIAREEGFEFKPGKRGPVNV